MTSLPFDISFLICAKNSLVNILNLTGLEVNVFLYGNQRFIEY